MSVLNDIYKIKYILTYIIAKLLYSSIKDKKDILPRASITLPHTTSSKKTLNLTFLDYHSHCVNCVF